MCVAFELTEQEVVKLSFDRRVVEGRARAEVRAGVVGRRVKRCQTAPACRAVLVGPVGQPVGGGGAQGVAPWTRTCGGDAVVVRDERLEWMAHVQYDDRSQTGKWRAWIGWGRPAERAQRRQGLKGLRGLRGLLGGWRQRSNGADNVAVLLEQVRARRPPCPGARLLC